MSAAGGIVGSTGSAAAPGIVREVISSNVSTPVNLLNNTQFNVTSITLTPGDWDIAGEVWITPSTATTGAQAAISNVSATFPSVSTLNQSRNTMYTTFAAGVLIALPLRTCSVIVTVNTIYYLLAYVVSTGTVTVAGNISARRC
jgi:hypothetical protein